MQSNITPITHASMSSIKSNMIAYPVYQHRLNRRYSFVEIITQGNEILNIRYEFSTSFIENKSGESLLVKINRTTPVYINDQIPDLVIDELAYETGKIFYPLIIETHTNGSFLRVFNQEEIINRWPAHKQKMLEYFTGEEVEKYLSLTEEIIASEEELNAIFQRDLFICTFFAPIYKVYPLFFCKDTQSFFPFAGKGSLVKFTVNETLNKYLTDTGYIEVIHSGSCIDERSFHEIEWNYNAANSEGSPSEISYEAVYHIEEECRFIETTRSKWIFNLNIPKIIEVYISLIEDKSLSKEQKVIKTNASQSKKKSFMKDFWDTLRGHDIK